MEVHSVTLVDTATLGPDQVVTDAIALIKLLDTFIDFTEKAIGKHEVRGDRGTL